MQSNIVILGNECTGKTTIARTFMGKPVQTKKYIPTIEDCYEKVLHTHNRTDLSIIDTAGTIKIFEHSRHLYKKTANAFIITYSVGSIDSWLRVINEYEHHKHEGKLIFIIGTYTNDYLHTDIQSTTSVVIKESLIARKIPYSQLIKLGIQHHIPVWEVNINDEKEIIDVMDQIINKMFIPTKSRSNSIFSRSNSGNFKLSKK